jgi:hypothetical protein
MNKPQPVDYPSDAKRRELEYYEQCRNFDAVDMYCAMPEELQAQVLQANKLYITSQEQER